MPRQKPEAPTEAPKKKTGRPSKYTPELAAEICERLSNGEPLRQICRDDHMPAWQKIYEWMARDEALSGAIARAREQGFEAIAEEALIIADTPMLGQKQVMTDQGTAITVEDMLGHRNPKKYGDKVQVGGDADNPLRVQADVTLFDVILTNLEAKRQSE
jgi:hypothetical protein